MKTRYARQSGASVCRVVLKSQAFSLRRGHLASYARAVEVCSLDKELFQLAYTFARGIGWDSERARELVIRLSKVSIFNKTCAWDCVPARSVSEDGHAVPGHAANCSAPNGNHGDNRFDLTSSPSTNLKGSK